MWLEIIYKPTSLFTLKMSGATNSAGKSLICPSPYSIKMALLNAIITYDSLKTAKENFAFIRDLEMKFCLPDNIVVNNCLIKIAKDNDKVSPAIKEMKPFKSTIAFREYVHLGDEIKIAVQVNFNDDLFIQDKIDFLQKWFMHINYFGKKGCFFQFISAKTIDELSDDYSKILDNSFPAGIMFSMDDVNETAQFKNLDNFDSSTKDAKRDKQIFIFGFQQISSNKNYTFYRRI